MPTRRTALLLAGLALWLLSGLARADAVVRDGIADLRHWDPLTQPILPLDGEWRLRWGTAGAEARPFVLPGTWNGRVLVDGEELPAFGHAWLSLTLRLPSERPPLALRFRDVKSAARFYLDGRLLASRGLPAASAAGEQPQLLPTLLSLPAEGTELELVVEISNHFHFEGGVDGRVLIGRQEVLAQRLAAREQANVAVLGATVALGLYLALLIRSRRQPYPALLFIAVLAISTLRLLMTSDLLANSGLSAATALRLEYLPLFLMPAFYAWLLRALFPDEVALGVCRLLSLGALAGSLAVVLLPVAEFTALRDPGAAMLVLALLYLFLRLALAVRARRRGAGTIAVGAVLLLLAVGNDALRYAHVFNSIDLASLGVLAFLFTHGLALGHRALDSLMENAALSERLAALNRDLESQVERRTRDLAERGEALRQARQAAEAEARQKSRFLATLGHELRTPLNGILGNLELLQRDLPAAAAGQRIERLREAGSSLLQVLEGVLEMAQAEAGRFSAPVRDFEPRQLLRGVTALLEPLARDQGLTIQATVDDTVPQRLSGPAGVLRQILVNLLSNAIKFTEQGGVRIALYPEGAQGYCLEVSDSGRGMSAAERDRVFEEFYRAPQANGPGAGVGLFIVARLAAAIGARIELDTAPGRGSRFRVHCRLQGAQAPASLPAPNRAGPWRLLLVEDVAANREMARELLSLEGHQVDAVADGESAVAAVAGTRYDAVLMDLRLEGMDGCEATRRIRALADTAAANTPVVALTADAVRLDRAFCRRHGLDAVVGKPLELSALYAALATLCEVEPPPSVAPVDGGRLEELAAELGPARVATLLGELDETCADQQRRLGELGAQGDGAELAAIAHRLSGAAANFGFTELAAAARRLRTAMLAERPQAVAELQATLDVTRVRLETWRRRYAGPGAGLEQEQGKT
ncbi:ATP-binding protein [Alkalilimnicola sp. S0819]|uniref:ATP-binding protein n=1 Tax=Alkalilimnicola sp. S0819 TaxID=2613922 RepID=UPI00126246D1|nr:ATP-binding protein [Alkalilimnicola sp. S0819]KAB7623808.1 response regulator [Alkalilimnicola sp. S0819]MPQ16682.1 response regulator [Alkalilimnicola sp. S0819]